ncbi:MAG: exodeoxyribonuclease VII large subunit [Lachnospiraceae bacterium]|nr:exodeoxyribonuclease VII large subunit [Lachnospiraceae bacterium]
MNPVYSVSEVNIYLKNLFNRDAVLSRIVVEGEVSNCKYHSTGHVYFTLKDSGGQLKCVMFASSRVKGLAFPMKEGDQVQALGRISIFERDGVYQMYADRIVLAGLGELYERFEQLKKRLYAEGLFDQEHKKPIPPYPKRIGIVTARTGAALQDILNILHRRNPYVQPILAPAQVQGEGASETIVRAIRLLEHADVDVIIVGRGGGSIEDLWAFNEEIVARAVYECPVPIISCVGHETDTTIIDYAADLRAPTPSAAAELAVGLAEELSARMVDYHCALTDAMTDIIERRREALAHAERLLAMQKPTARLARRRERMEAIERQLRSAMENRLAKETKRLAVAAARLDGMSPLKKLGGGFGYVSDPDGKPVVSVTQRKPGETIRIVLKDGELNAEVKNAVTFSDPMNRTE